ncbi:MAG: hypothetical protein ACRD3E_17540 [Terriglobales bacterium]
MPTNPPKKSAPAKSATKKKSTAKRSPAKKTAAKKSAAAPKKSAGSRKDDTLQNVARSIGATLGSFAKSTTDALKAAKQVLPNLKHSAKDTD